MSLFNSLLFFYLTRHYLIICLLLLTSSAWAELSQETIYLTWQRSPATTMTVQWISFSADKETFLAYRLKEGKGDWLKAAGETLPFPSTSEYLIHRVELEQLTPNTEYIFKVLPEGREYQFLTAPSHLTQLHFVVGGDMYHDSIQLMENTCKEAAQANPLFALIGGDIAYAVQSIYFPLQKIERWLTWVKTWHATMVTPQGNLVPVIPAIGNHDLIGQFDQTPLQAAVFSALFPMPGKQIYNVLDFNDYLSVFILDSGHANPISGKQTNWLSRVLEERQQTIHRLALYHVPAYPSVRSFRNKESLAIRHSWVPLFEKGGIQTAFEHHDHAYKRTYLLLKDRIDPQGILYIGDGCWGVEKPRILRSRYFYLAKFAPLRHFIKVILTPDAQIFTSISDQGKVIDEYHRSIQIKVLN